MSQNFSRRKFLGSLAACSLGFAAAGSLRANPPAATPPLPPRPSKPLDPNDPTAKALSYVADRAKADENKFAQLKTPEGKKQNCKSCQLFWKSEKGWGQCQVLPAGLVPENGWCAGWAKRA